MQGMCDICEAVNALAVLTFKPGQCSPVVVTLALRSCVPGFKIHSDHSLNLFLVVPGSTSQLHL